MYRILVAAVLVLLFLFWLLRRRRQEPFDGRTALPYRRRALMTPTELAVYARLLDALPEYMVFAQVQASRVLDIADSRRNYYWFNFVSRLSYDFVVCRTDGTPLAAIEVDDASHRQAVRQEADQRKNLATQAAGVVILRWPVGDIPDVAAIARMMRKIDRKAA